MTIEGLLDAIAMETKEALGGFCLRGAKENQHPINVYTQDLPLKEGKGDENIYPYVCVCYDSSEIENPYDGKENVGVYFVMGIIDKGKDNQGYRDILQMAERIKQHFFRKGVIQNAFRLAYPVRTAIQQENTYPYFIGGIEAKCELFIVTEEDKYI